MYSVYTRMRMIGLLRILGVLVEMVTANDVQLIQFNVELAEDIVRPPRIIPFRKCEGAACNFPKNTDSFAIQQGDSFTNWEGFQVAPSRTATEHNATSEAPRSQSVALERREVENKSAAEAPHTPSVAPEPIAGHNTSASGAVQISSPMVLNTWLDEVEESLTIDNAGARNFSDVHVSVKPMPGEDYVMWNLTNASFHSNLGGKGPDDGEQALRYFNVARVSDPDGNPRFLDLVVTALGEYKVNNAGLNGVVDSGSGFGQINVQSNSTGANSVSLLFDWVFADSNTSVAPDRQFFTIYDVDGSKKSHETITFYNRSHAVYLSKNTELTQSGNREQGLTFSAEGLTNNVPLPENPEDLTEEQKNRAVTVSYIDKHQYMVTFTVSGGNSGRNFAFAGHSALARNETDSDTSTRAARAPRTGEDEFTPTPTPATTTCEQAGTCAIYEDPHIRVFDGMQISLLAAKTRMLADYGAGDMWLVRSPDISIQGRYLPDPDLVEANLFVRAVAVGGPFLKGNTLILGPLDEEVSWDGAPILQNQTSNFKAAVGRTFVRAKRHVDSHLVQDMSQKNAGVDVELPLGVKVTVNRFKKHVNVFIDMPPAAGGQDGMCGNYNCHAADDTLDMILTKRNPRVFPGESLFDQ